MSRIDEVAVLRSNARNYAFTEKPKLDSLLAPYDTRFCIFVPATVLAIWEFVEIVYERPFDSGAERVALTHGGGQNGFTLERHTVGPPYLRWQRA